MAEKRNIFLVGPMGAGKSTIGRHLADELHLDFYDSDQEIERRSGADIAWIFDLEGEDGFRAREENIINDLTDKQGIVLATGGGSIVTKAVRNRLSARGIVVYLQTTIDKQVARTQRDKRRPLLQNDDPEQVLRDLADLRNPLYEEVADYVVDTDDQSARAVANQIISKIGL
ncbi:MULTISPECIES: shikimate kinase AroK [Alteromonas]|jgi:shikimate kinase|uniref:Shikimate kinase n=1 Tax=Alteromonas stellipolaris TaxID=233316 RepID=A0AAW7Z717_9ALTE|nr:MULTISPECIES: shikimate kinase AroK [Alteromonas]AMJ89362.1 shikimate kinase [Alteromonas sp. Mac2]ALM92101.1 Shikimate kinase I [Alteromonas stellipolaris LMG 21856]AMJ73083.1 shikimate kinase [Alteromonas stellipolaris]AMJ85475.1 shikimate kinase [Alteromonas sp. Mac1]AMJ93193.1 shikimate kinase [Alteromonas stellipolaris]|tara:strand:+ start:1125 stop:1640 length:516 start_codon:yes stop_codon:yes gene_type:complete|mmetsp:Transcript_32958/g.86268  ORF Transcript_32958/g.86268 Transcript_32958/m.86268 type:complete len:172 (+) Transcript_32958:298-813(+)